MNRPNIWEVLDGWRVTDINNHDPINNIIADLQLEDDSPTAWNLFLKIVLSNRRLRMQLNRAKQDAHRYKHKIDRIFDGSTPERAIEIDEDD